MELKFLVFPFLSIVCPRALRIPLQVSGIGLPPHLQPFPNPGQTMDREGFDFGACYIQHPEICVTWMESPVNDAERSGAWNGRHKVKDINHDKHNKS